MKLSKRLHSIQSLVSAEYQHIWDTCCDHGLLGATLLASSPSSHIHFVDIVPDLMDQLEKKLIRYFPQQIQQWTCHCRSVADIPIANYSGKQLIIIAGVGGKLMSQLLTELKLHQPKHQFDLLLCPVNQAYALRQQLIKLKFSLKKEQLIEDKQRYYEIILASSCFDQHQLISPVGEYLWLSDDIQQKQIVRDYLASCLEHYQRIEQGNPGTVQAIIDAYQGKKDELQ